MTSAVAPPFHGVMVMLRFRPLATGDPCVVVGVALSVGVEVVVAAGVALAVGVALTVGVGLGLGLIRGPAVAGNPRSGKRVTANATPVPTARASVFSFLSIT